MKAYESTKKSQLLTDMGRRILDVGAGLDFTDTALAAILLASRSMLWPYLGLVHDARLYAFQAFNHSQNGKFGQDLFFVFGSQDSYSVFSLLMGPLVSWIGLKAAFWLVYMLSSALLAYAEVRLVRRLVPDRNLANLGLLALSAMVVPYGGWGIFNVHESFLTARLPAQGLALLGVEETLQGRWLKALMYISAGMALHPLMAIGALALLAGVFAWQRLQTRNLIGFMGLVLGVVALVALLTWAAAGSHMGVMDEAWFTAVKKVSWHCFLSRWRALDWYWLIGSHALVLWGCRWLKPEAGRLVYAAVLVCAGGLITTAMGEFLRSPLLLQGQGYRSLWVTELLVVPLGLLVADRLSRVTTPYGRWAALGVVAFLGNPFIVNPGVASVAPLLLGIYILLSAFWACVSFKQGSLNWVDALWQGLLAGMISVAVILSSLVVIAAVRLGFSERMDPIVLLYDAAVSISPLVLTLTVLVAFWALSCLVRDRRKLPVCAVFIWVFLGLAVAVAQENSKWKEQFQTGYGDLEFIADVIDSNGSDAGGQSKVQVYWPVDSNLIWFNLQMNCYYSFSQLVGIVFSGETAAEGVRRAALVRLFEVAQMRMDKVHESAPGVCMQLELSGGTFGDRPPAREDLLRLAEDERLDWVVLYEKFEGLYRATNGCVFIYDCHAIRGRRAFNQMDSSLEGS